ncbi:unnamed protein product [Rotaria sp. Silwood1]|nr:unnamed protein product [Rotaria sp. Silwood1]CAF5030683.1 unnamed protein product [Rotaria sp. Silwood1]
MTSQQKILSSDRILSIPRVDIDDLECSICRGLLWKPVACQSCETPFCSSCIHQWLVDHPKHCPNRCETYIERKCPPFVAKLLAQLNMHCFYRSYGCNQVTSYEGLDKHEIECGFQPRQCPGCKSQILKKDFDNHTSTCPSIELTCQNCKLVFKRADLNQKHTEIICLKEQIRQLQYESKEYKREIHELNLQLDEMRIMNPSITETKITFNDLQGTADNCYRIPAQYRGLEWTGMNYIHKSFAIKNHPTSGYATSFMPNGSSYIAYFRGEASVSVKNPDEIFTLFSVTACAAWNDNLQLIITGYRNVLEIKKHTVTLLFGKPQFILLHWEDIDKVTFVSSGGTAHPGSGSATGPQVILTQITMDSLE